MEKWWEKYPAVAGDQESRLVPKKGEPGAFEEVSREDELLLRLKQNEEEIRRQRDLQAAREYVADALPGQVLANQIIVDTVSPIERMLGFGERADELNRSADLAEQALREQEAGGAVPDILQRGFRGAARSLAGAVIASRAGGAIAGPRFAAASAIGGASLQEANRAWTEGKDQGLEGGQLLAYAGSQGVIEALPAAIMQRAGMGGMESVVAGQAVRSGVKQGVLDAIKRTGQEIPEELVTEIGHLAATEIAGMDKDALTSESIQATIADTIVQTVLTMGMAESPGLVKDAAKEVKRKFGQGEDQALKAERDAVAEQRRKMAEQQAQESAQGQEQAPEQTPGVPADATPPAGEQANVPEPTAQNPGKEVIRDEEGQLPEQQPAGDGLLPKRDVQGGQGQVEPDSPPDGASDNLSQTPEPQPEPGAEGGRTSPPSAPEQAGQEQAGQKPIGQNRDGQPVYEGEKGQRYVVNEDGVRIEEKVALRPQRRLDGRVEYVGEIDTENRDDRYKIEGEYEPAQPDSQEMRKIGGEKANDSLSQTTEEPAEPEATPVVGQTTPVVSETPGTRKLGEPKKDEGRKHDFASTQFDMPPGIAAEVQKESAKIADEDLAENGREEQPHITVKYGLEIDDPTPLRELLKDQPPVRVKVGKTSIFPANEQQSQRGGSQFDVVKIDIEGDELRDLNARIADAVPNQDTFPEYNPHMTLGYVKPGMGQKYAGDNALEGQEFLLEELTFSARNGELVTIPLQGNRQLGQTTPSDSLSQTESVQEPAQEFEANRDKAVAKFKSEWGKTVTPREPANAEEQDQIDFLRSRGKQASFIDGDGSITGAVDSSTGFILISGNRESNDIWRTIGHELAHETGLDKIIPADSAELASGMEKRLARSRGVYRKRLESDAALLEREARADIVGNFLRDKAFRDRLSAENPTLWEKLRDAVLKVVGKWTPRNEAQALVLKELRKKPETRKLGQPEPASDNLSQNDADLEAMIEAEFDAQTAKPESDAPPRRLGQPERQEPAEKPPTKIRQAADKARQEADDLWAQFNQQAKEKLSTGLDPQLAKLAVKVALAEIKAGTLTFAAFVENTAAKVPADMLDKVKPYMEMAWKVAHKRGMTNDPAGRFDDVRNQQRGEQQGEKEGTPQSRIATRVRDALEAGDALTAQAFFTIADEEFGGTRANGVYGDSQATDALELGVNLYLQGKTNANATAEEAKATIEQIRDVMKLVPRHRGRTGNKSSMQQFSTPPAYAYAVNWIANITDADVVLEPSAGMGGIAIHAANSGATVYANELDETRAEGLQELPLEDVFTEDAEQIDATLQGKLPGLTAVVMNPPFSRAGKRMGDRMIQGMDRRHIDKAMALLPDGGRLVAIVGAGLHGPGQKMTQWLESLPHRLTANVEVARDVYRGYGTEFPTRVLVIDKVPRGDAKPITGKAEDLADLIDKTVEVRDAREQARIVERDAAQQDGKTAVGSDEQASGPEGDARDTTDPGVPSPPAVGERQDTDGGRVADRGDGDSDANTQSSPTGGNTGRGSRGGKSGRQTGKSGKSDKRKGTKRSGDGASGKSGSVPAGVATKVRAKTQPRAKKAGKELTESTFEEYVPSVVVEGASAHPAPIVESAAMAAVDSPQVDYEVDLMPGVLEGYVNDDGVYVGISGIQLEAIALAGNAHQQTLPSGERRGFLIGDGTGVGKAREALGIIMDDFIKRGEGDRRKAVFITKNDGLVKDAVSEWVGVGGDVAEMHQLSKVASGQAVDFESGVLTLSYDTLKGEASAPAKAQGNELSRVDQIVEWVGGDFDGVVVFDEAHLMGNALDTGTGSRTSQGSKRAQIGIELQQRLPNARVVYLSATAATEVRNLAYADRLGLWGQGTQFATKHAFISQIDSGGVAAMEKVAADMKAMGMYVARNLSYDDGTPTGRVEFDRIAHTLTDDQREIYDKLSEAWIRVLANIDEALEITGNTRGKSRLLSSFWSANQRFWNDVVTSMTAPTLIQNIEKDLAEGRSVVVQLYSTKQAATDRAIGRLQEGQTYDEVDASPRRELMSLVERAFPVQRHEEYEDDNGNIRTRPVVDSEGKPVLDPQAVAMKEQLLAEIGSLDVGSRGPLDLVIDHFGRDMVAEVSGRSQRLVVDDDGKMDLEKRGKNASRADRDDFMEGRKRVLLFTEAGGTGASYHASLSQPNQERRSHYLWQPGWSAPTAVQGLGRAHRSNQASAPLLHLLEPNLEGYKRFISTIARRLSQLGALTKGQRTAADAGLFGANDNLESTEANRALFQFVRDALDDDIDGIDRDFLVQRMGLEQLAGNVDVTPESLSIQQFLNRLLNLPVEQQNRVFNEFQGRLDGIVGEAIQNGTLDQGMETVKAEKITKANEQVVHEHETGAQTKWVQLTLTHKTNPMNFGDVLRKAAGYTSGRLHGFARSATTGKVFAVLDLNRTSQDSRGRVQHDAIFFGVQGPSYGHTVEQISNPQYWEQLPRDQAKGVWDAEFAASPTTIDTNLNVLTGALLPVWNKLVGAENRVVRAMTADGETILGRVIHDRYLDQTLNNLGVMREGETQSYTPTQAMQAVYQGGTATLANGWTIKKRRIDGEDNIEVIGPDYRSKEVIEQANGIQRTIDYKTRYFLPFNDSRGESLATIIGQVGRIVSVTMPRSDRASDFRVAGQNADGAISSEEQADAEDGSATAPQETGDRRLGDGKSKPIRRADIVTTWSRLFDVPIRLGGYRDSRGKGQVAAGVYKHLQEIIRMREGDAFDIIVASHEIGHHLDKKLNLFSKSGKRGPSEDKDSKLAQLKKDDQKRYIKVKGQLQALDYDDNQTRIWEGIAEAVRQIITGTAEKAHLGPDAVAWVREQIMADPVFGPAMEQAVRQAKQYENQGAVKRAQMVFGGPPIDLDPAARRRQSLREFIYSTYKGAVDSRYAAKEFSDAIAKSRKLGDDEASVYETISVFDARVNGMSGKALVEGVHTLDGERISQTSLKDAINLLKKGEDRNDADAYMVAKFGLTLPRGYNFGMDRKDAEDYVAWVESDSDRAQRWQEYHRIHSNFFNDLVELEVRHGNVTREEAERILGTNRDMYVPLMRDMSDRKERKLGGGSQMVELPKAFRRRTKSGSGRPVLPMLEQAMRRAKHHYSRVVRQEIHNTIVDQISTREGLGRWVDKIPPRTAVEETSVEAILSQLVDSGIVDSEAAYAMRRAKDYRMGIDLSERALDRLAEYYGIEQSTVIEDQIDAVLERLDNEPDIEDAILFYRPDYRRPNGKYVIKVIIGGKPELYEVDPRLYEALEGAPPETQTWITKAMDFGNRLFKTGSVGNNTAFLLTNLFRDSATFLVNSRYTSGKDRVTAPWRWTAEYAATIANAKPNELVEMYREYGGDLYNYYAVDDRSMKKTARRLGRRSEGGNIAEARGFGKVTAAAKSFGGEMKNAAEQISEAEGAKKALAAAHAFGDGLENFADMLRTATAMSDVGPRLAEAEGYLKTRGFEIRDGKFYNTKTEKFELPSRDQFIRAMYAAGDVTYNYRRRGSIINKVERIFPFTNAAIQSLDKTVRVYREMLKDVGSSKEDQKKLANQRFIALMTMSSIYLALKYLMLDDEDELDQWEKDGYVTISLPGDSGRVSIGMSREHAWIANATTAGLRYFLRDDKEAIRDYAREEMSNRIPFGFSGAAGTVAEQMMNRNVFRDRPIEPEYMRSGSGAVSPRYRYDQYTTEASKFIGKLTGLSPMRLDHGLSGITGGMWNRWAQTGEKAAVPMLQAMGTAKDADTQPFTVRDIPFLRGVYRDDVPNASVSDFYDRQAKIQIQLNDMVAAGVEPDTSLIKEKESFEIYATLMKLLRESGGPDYDPSQHQVALARAAMGLPDHPNYPNPMYTELPDQAAEALRKAAFNNLDDLSRDLGRPSQSEEESDEEYAEKIRVWEAKREGEREFWARYVESPIVESAVKDVRGSDRFKDLLRGKGAPQRNRGDKPLSQYREETRRFGQRQEAARKFLKFGEGG